MPDNDGTLTNREFALLLAVCTIVVIVIALVVNLRDVKRLEACEADKLDVAKHLYECAQDLERAGQICSETARASMIRSTQLFECEQSVCKANGWMEPVQRFSPPPEAWEAREAE